MAQTTYSDEVDADNPYLWWKLDETSGTQATDSSGNARHGTYVNTPTLGATALINEGKSADFNGSNEYVKWEPSSDWSGDFTIECWFQADTNTYDTIFGAWRANATNGYGTNIAINDGGSFDVNVARDNYDFWLVNAAKGSISTGTRYHIAVTCNNTANEVKFYVNGAQAGTTESFGTTFNGGIWSSGNEIRVAAAGEIDSGSLDGRIQHFAIYSTALSAARIEAHYEAGKDKDIDAVKTDIDIGGNTNTSISTSAQINQIDTNIGIGGNTNTTIDIANSVLADVTNVTIAATAPVISAEQNATINQTTTNIDIQGHNVTLAIQGNIFVGADITDINIDQTDPLIQINDTITVAGSNINVDGLNALNLYPSLVTEHDPVHYFRFLSSDTSFVTDYGSVSIAGTLYNVNLATDLESGIFGDPDSSGIRLDGVQSSSAQAITWGSQNIWNTNGLLDLNGAIEFWFKTASPNVALLSMDNVNAGTPTNPRTAYVGLVDGKLGFRYSITLSPESWAFIDTGLRLDDNEWHHVIMTKSYNSTTQTFINKSYVDAEETPVVLSLSTFINFNATYGNRRMIGSYGTDSGDNVAKLFNYSVLIDELAIYNINLTEQDVNDHFIAGSGYNDVEIEPTVTDITIDQTTSNVGTVVFVDSSNIQITSPGIVINAGGVVTIIPTFTNTVIEGIDSSLANTGTRIIYQQKTNTIVTGKQNRVRVGDIFFKFISAQDTALSANDAETLESLDFGGLLFNQTKKLLFRIGNQEDNPTDFNITITSKESIVENAVQLSKDNITYSSSVIVEQLPPNQISPIIYVKLDVNALDTLGNGTFLINVEKV